MGYRVHVKGTIHCLAGCCKRGQKIIEENYFEVCTIEEAEARLKKKNIVPNRCSFCNWLKDKEATTK